VAAGRRGESFRRPAGEAHRQSARNGSQFQSLRNHQRQPGGGREESHHGLANRAFRRPASSEAITRYTKLVTDALADSATFENAVRLGCKAFFAEVLRANLPAANFIHSDFAMLNRRLADHYGIAGVPGETMQKVALKPEQRPGGLLTQASILKVTANGTTSSPVLRGVWMLKHLLGTPPNPPPADVGSVEPDTRGATTIREQLAKHSNQASCAGCHQYIDPPGFAIESYDVIGGFRDATAAAAQASR